MNKIDKKEVISILKNIPKYELTVDGCSCCGEWIESKISKYGEWVKLEDIEKIILQLKTK